MNPFQLTGFSFLGFYIVLGVVVFWGLRMWFRHLETADAAPQQNMTDPYLIAHLRAGANEALRVATVALLDRGLLTAVGETLTTKDGNAVGVVQRPIEKAILQRYRTPGEGHDIFKDSAAKSACASYDRVLKNQRMIADGGTYAKRFVPVAVALGVLITVTWTKVTIAFSQGRHNVGFLIALTILFTIIAMVVWFRRRTALGDAMLTDLRSLFARLKGRAKSMRAGGQTNEAALLAAVFGLSALPAANFPFMEKLYPAKSSDGSGCSSSSCSSGSSCGGGCGGGGCGG
ncbi:MAG: TIGR04222 domain-containing membrane protein [Betaproteobacteria bacterium]|nr:TIGR04222 domain-containing membrane protein [Betaproteobacteria bacterium]